MNECPSHLKGLQTRHNELYDTLLVFSALSYTAIAPFSCALGPALIGPTLMTHKIASLFFANVYAEMEPTTNYKTILAVEVVIAAILSPVTTIFIAVVVGSVSSGFIIGISCLAFAHTCLYIPYELLFTEGQQEPVRQNHNAQTPRSIVSNIYVILGRENLNSDLADKLDRALRDQELSKVKRYAGLLFHPDRVGIEQYRLIEDLYSELNNILG